MAELPSAMGSFSLGEASFLSHIGRDALREYCKNNTIRHYRTGPRGHHRITRENLILFMNSNNIPLDLSLQGTCPQHHVCAPEDFNHKGVKQ